MDISSLPRAKHCFNSGIQFDVTVDLYTQHHRRLSILHIRRGSICSGFKTTELKEPCAISPLSVPGYQKKPSL